MKIRYGHQQRAISLNARGAALPIMLLVMVVVAILGMAVNLASVNESRLAQSQYHQTQSFWAAEAGAQRTMWEILSNNCHGMTNQGSGAACTSCSSCGIGNLKVSGTVPSGEFEVIVASGAASAVASGYSPSKVVSKAQRRIQFTIGAAPIFSYAAFAKGLLKVDNNALVDSYNSNNGNYGGANIGTNGDIGSNGTSAGIIQIGNNATIKGDVGTGAGGTVTQGGGSTITGQITHTNNVALGSVVVPSSLTSLASGGSCAVPANGNRTLAAGDYKYTTVSFGNNSELIINGNVNMYLTGAAALTAANNDKITINNGAVFILYTDGVVNIWNNVQINNVSKKAANFQIYSTYAGANGISIKNNSNAYITLYSPDTDIVVSNNATFYGAMVGKTLEISNNDQVHYDEALGSLASPFSSARMSNWQEI